MNKMVLNLDLVGYEGYSFNSGWNADFHIWKVGESKTHYNLYVSDSGDYMGKKFSAPQYLSTTTIKISRGIKRNGCVLVNFEFRTNRGNWGFDCDSIDVSTEAFRTPNDFADAIYPILNRFFDKMAKAHNEFVSK